MLDLFIWFIFIKICKPSYLSVEYTKIMGSYQFPIYIGTPRQKMLLSMDMTNNYTWISRYFYNSNKSTSVTKINDITKINFGCYSFDFSELNDTIWIKNLDNFYSIFFNFYFLTSELFSSDNYEGIGTAYKFENENFSFIHQLYNNKIISEKSFGFYPQKPTKGLLYLGNIPQKELNKKYTYKIKVLPNHKTWNIAIKKINDYQNIFEAYFDSNEDYTKAPISFISYLKEKIFKSFLENQSCKLFNDSLESNTYFYCLCRKIQNFPKFVFYIDNYAITLNFSQMFVEDEGKCFLSINPNKENKWIFGTLFLQNFATEFDYLKNQIRFHTEIKFVSVKSDLLFLVYFTCFLFLSLGTFLLFIVKMKNSFCNSKSFEYKQFVNDWE